MGHGEERHFETNKSIGDGKDKEVEVEEQRDVGENPGDLPDKMKVKIQEDPSRSTPQSRGSKSPWLERDELFSPTRDVTDVTIAREMTPPPHARGWCV